MTTDYDFLVIGSGPAGLAFASSLDPNKSCLLVDIGKEVDNRKHDSSQDLACGAGGAGFYSDGKFSFFPAGTEVWKLSYPLINKAYQQLKDDLGPFCQLPELSTQEELRNYFFQIEQGTWKLKEYPTQYIDLNNRKQLITNLVSKIKQNPKNKILMQHQVKNIRKMPDQTYGCNIKNLILDENIQINVRNIVLAGGRFMPIYLPQLFTNHIPMTFKRYEFGVRIQNNSNNPVMIGKLNNRDFSNVVDPKFRYLADSKGNVEFRTFCWCRNGEVTISDFNGMSTFSGRSDCGPSDLSNFGFLVRTTNQHAINHDEFKKICNIRPFQLSLTQQDFQEQSTLFTLLLEKYGNYIGYLIYQALQAITTEFPQLINHGTASIFGPSIEGMGYYPDIDHNLQLKDNPGVYVLGDCTGTFRGIIPSMISGYYLSQSIKMMEETNITFVTTNPNKAREVQQILGPIKIKLLNKPIPKIQGTIEQVISHKCNYALDLIKGPVIVEDSSLIFKDWNNKLPGPYINDFLDAVGPSGIVKMLEASDDKTATAISIFAISFGHDHPIKIYKGITHGKIVSARGKQNFGWDSIFEIDEEDEPENGKTFAEINFSVKNRISHRARALQKIKF